MCGFTHKAWATFPHDIGMKEENALEKAKETFTEFLQASHLRKTPERYAVLERAYRSEGHFSAESLYRDMQTEYRVSRATVYNTLELLLQSRLVVKHQFGQQEAQYEKVVPDKVHHHLVCTGCGKVKEFSDKHIRTTIQARRFAYFEPEYYTLYIYGLCSKCRQKKRGKK